MDFELPCKLLKHGYDIREIPISYHPRTIEQGKGLGGVRAFRTGFRVLWVYLRVLLRG
jgi:hypothetical protein